MVVPLGAVLSREIISELYHSNVSVVLSSSSSCSFYTHTLAVLCNTAPMFSVLVAFHDLAKKKILVVSGSIQLTNPEQVLSTLKD